MTPDTIPCPPPDDWSGTDSDCPLCGYAGTECSCRDCARGENVVLVSEYAEGDQASA